MRNTRVWICLLLVCFLLLTVLCVGCAKTPDEPDHSDAPPTVTTTTADGDFETEIIVPDKDDIATTTTTLGYTTGTGVDGSTAHVTVTTDDGKPVTTDGGTPVTSYVSTTTTTTTTTEAEEQPTTTTKSEVKLPFVPFD